MDRVNLKAGSAANMSRKQPITCVLRRPRFPLVCDFDGYLFAARSLAALQLRIAGLVLPDERNIRFCDASGESWMLLPNEMILAPDFPMRRWRKIEVIRLFNESRNAKDIGLRYPESVIPNRRLDAIVKDLAALLLRSRVTKANSRQDGYTVGDEK